jgi:hypothetical protein
MRYTGTLAALFVAAILTVPAAPAQPSGEGALAPQQSSAGKALALSLAVPGLGHRYVRGDWDGWASVFAVVDAGLWAGLLGVELHRGHLVEGYRTLAAQHAGVDPTDKDRTFYVNVATFASSEAFVDAQLRNRTWERVPYVDDPSYRWAWDSEVHFRRFRETRERSESLRRRRTFIITSLVANRLIAGVTALRTARGAGQPDLSLSLDVPPAESAAPLLRIGYSF